MKENQYIYFTDVFGVVCGRIDRVSSTDCIVVEPIVTSINTLIGGTAYFCHSDRGLECDVYTVDLRKVKNIKIYETRNKLIEEHFEEFL